MKFEIREMHNSRNRRALLGYFEAQSRLSLRLIYLFSPINWGKVSKINNNKRHFVYEAPALLKHHSSASLIIHHQQSQKLVGNGVDPTPREFSPLIIVIYFSNCTHCINTPQTCIFTLVSRTYLVGIDKW